MRVRRVRCGAVSLALFAVALHAPRARAQGDASAPVAAGSASTTAVGLAAPAAPDAPSEAVTKAAPRQVEAPAPPPGMAAKQRLSSDDLEKKREDDYFTGLPLANSDPNTGYGFGARVYHFENGKRSDPLFAYVPYRRRVFLQGFATTKGLQFHWLDLDVINVADSPYRVRAQAIYERNTNRNFFGIGASSLRPLSFPGDPRSFRRFDDYEAALEQARPDGTAFSRYNKIGFERPLLLASIERPLVGGVVRPLLGVGIARARVFDATGDVVTARGADGSTVEAIGARTRLRDECDAGRLVGCGGGWDNTLRLGVSYDTRDFEPDPNSGVFVDLSVEIGSRVLGSGFDYVRAMIAPKVFYSPFPELADLVVAARGVYEVQSSGAPFFSMNTMPFIEDPRIGLGGLRSMRGFKQDRFVGPVMALANFELRYTFTDFKALSQRFALIAVPFVDMGRVFDRVADTTLRGWRRTQGAGLHIAWNQATLVIVDYGKNEEDSGLYINFNHQF